MMSDIRESGSIEQDADIVAFLYRDDYYNRGEGDEDDDDAGFEPQTNDDNGEIEIIIAKQRNGPTGTVKLHFMKQYNKFTDIDYAHQICHKNIFPYNNCYKSFIVRFYCFSLFKMWEVCVCILLRHPLNNCHRSVWK